MKILLTNKEIRKVMVPHDGWELCMKGEHDVYCWEKDIAQAQLKKVVGYISQYIYSKKGGVHILMAPYAWQALLKEVEDEPLVEEKMGILCWLGWHRKSPSEISYNFDTKIINLHCKSCQKIIDKIESETQLTDEQYYWFKQIFENF